MWHMVCGWGGRSDVYRVLVGKPEEGSHFGRIRSALEDNNSRHLVRIGWHWIGFSWLTLRNVGV